MCNEKRGKPKFGILKKKVIIHERDWWKPMTDEEPGFLASLGGCGFFDFSPIPLLKTMSLGTKKSSFRSLVTTSRNDSAAGAEVLRPYTSEEPTQKADL